LRLVLAFLQEILIADIHSTYRNGQTGMRPFIPLFMSTLSSVSVVRNSCLWACFVFLILQCYYLLYHMNSCTMNHSPSVIASTTHSVQFTHQSSSNETRANDNYTAPTVSEYQRQLVFVTVATRTTMDALRRLVGVLYLCHPQNLH
jgi:hypothetical protein